MSVKGSGYFTPRSRVLVTLLASARAAVSSFVAFLEGDSSFSDDIFVVLKELFFSLGSPCNKFLLATKCDFI